MERYAGLEECQIRLAMKKADLIDWFKEKKAPMPKGSGKKGRVLVRDLVEARKKFLAKGGEEEESKRRPLVEGSPITQENFDRYAEKIKKYRKAIGLGSEDTVGFSEGPKYLRVYIEDARHQGKSVWSFVDKATGDIYKADGWKQRGRSLGQSILGEGKEEREQEKKEREQEKKEPSKKPIKKKPKRATLPKSLDDVTVGGLYTILYTQLMKKAMSLPSGAPLLTQLLDIEGKISDALVAAKPAGLKGAEAMKVFLDVALKELTPEWPLLERIVRKYPRVKIDQWRGTVTVAEAPKEAPKATGEEPVAKAIREQIGNRAFFMMGVKRLTSHGEEGALSFRIGRNPKGVNYVKITLDKGRDLYNIEFGRIHGTTYKVKSSMEGVDVDSLHGVIEEGTSMALSLNPRPR